MRPDRDFVGDHGVLGSTDPFDADTVLAGFAGNQVCVGTRPDSNVCGSFVFFGWRTPVHCDDVVVQKTKPDGQTIYTRILSGESDEIPSRLVFDAQDNVVVFGTTYSTQFPTTPDAVQRTYRGPQPPYANYSAPLPTGGDLFLSILGPSGDLLHSTFLGSSGNDMILGLRPASNGQIDILVSAGESSFPTVPPNASALKNGPVLLTFDLNRRTIVRSGYLPIAAPGAAVAYHASLLNDGTVAVTTGEALYTFGRDGQLRTFVSLEAFEFSGLPGASADPAGDVWLVGSTRGRQLLVAELTGGTAEAFGWILPIAGDAVSSLTYLQPPFFGPDGLTYLGGSTLLLSGSNAGKLQSTTPNALLTAPCSPYSVGIVAVLSAQGDVKLLSYLTAPAKSFAADPDGSVSVILSDGHDTRISIDLRQHPKAACVRDALDRVTSAPPTLGVGEVVRLRGGGFGPEAPVKVTPGADQHFPRSLDGLAVEVAGIAAPVLSAASGEVVFAIPFETPDGDAIPVTVRDRDQTSAVLPIAVRAAAPWLVEPILNEDGTRNWFDTPAVWGSTVTLFVTGAGPYSPSLDDGEVAPADTSHRLQLPTSISFQTTGPTPEPGTILYAGPAPGFVGLAQIKVQLPQKRPLSSIVPLLTIGGVSAYLPSIWLQ